MKCSWLWLLLVFSFIQSHAQEKQPLDDGGLYANVFAAGGKAAQLGVSLGEFNTTLMKHFFTTGAFFEAGIVLPNGTEGTSGFISINHLSVYSLPRTQRFLPFWTAGYSHFIGSGNAVNFGSGIIYRYKVDQSCCANELRFEARDYYMPGQDHRLTFRFSWGGELWGDS